MTTFLLTVDWNAVGAIGTAIGSIVTAIALIVAIIQLKQPTKKAIKVFSANGFAFNQLGTTNVLYVDIKNKGNRDVQIHNVYLMVGKKKLFLQQLQTPNTINFPYVLQTESMVTVYYSYDKCLAYLREKTQTGELDIGSKMRFMVVDGVGDNHYGNKVPLIQFIGTTENKSAN